MEASIAGLPTVAFRTGGMPEIAHEGVNGLLAEPENERDLAEKLAVLISDSKLRRTMGEKAKAVAAKEFNLSTQVSKLVDIYESEIN
jgi:glycosyltransferase involved in cell wall biosynthesis